MKFRKWSPIAAYPTSATFDPLLVIGAVVNFFEGNLQHKNFREKVQFSTRVNNSFVLKSLSFYSGLNVRREGKLVYKYLAKCKLESSSFEFRDMLKLWARFFRQACSAVPSCADLNPTLLQFDRQFDHRQKSISPMWSLLFRYTKILKKGWFWRKSKWSHHTCY